MILRSPTFENYPTMDSASSWAPPTSVTEGQEEIDEVLLQPKLQKLAARKYYEKQRQWRESQRDGSRNSYNGSHFSHPGELILEAVVDTEVEEEELMRLREGDEDDIDPAEISTAYLLSRRQMTQDSYELDEVFLQARQHPRKTKTERKSSRGDATSDDQRVSDSSSRTSSQARRRQQQPHRGDPHLRLYSTNDIHAKVPKVRLYRNTSDSAVPATLISQPISNGHSEITEETPLGSLEVKNSKVRRDLMFNGDFNGNDKSEDIQQEGEEAETDMLSSTSSQHGSVQELNRDDQISPVDSHSSKGLKSETCV